MNVKVTLTVEVDRPQVEAEYGEKMSAAEIRDWVRHEAATATESALSQVAAVVHVAER